MVEGRDQSPREPLPTLPPPHILSPPLFPPFPPVQYPSPWMREVVLQKRTELTEEVAGVVERRDQAPREMLPGLRPAHIPSLSLFPPFPPVQYPSPWMRGVVLQKGTEEKEEVEGMVKGKEPWNAGWLSPPDCFQSLPFYSLRFLLFDLGGNGLDFQKRTHISRKRAHAPSIPTGKRYHPRCHQRSDRGPQGDGARLDRVHL